MSNDEETMGTMSMDPEDIEVRTMEIPRWMSTSEVTKYLVSGGRGKELEDEYDCTITIAGKGSGCRDATVPGYHLPHLLITFTGRDVRQLGRLRRDIEDSLIDFVIDNAAAPKEPVNPPWPLGRLLYSLGLTAANASPTMKDRRPKRTILCRSHFPAFPHTKRGEDGQGPAKKVWMNMMELPKGDEDNEYHGRFLVAPNHREYYKHLGVRVDIYGVWSNEEDDNMCDPYALITGPEKIDVDKCVMYIEHRIREHEDSNNCSREGGRRVLRGEYSYQK